MLLPMVLTVGYSFTEWNGFGADDVRRSRQLPASRVDDAVFRDSFVHVVIYIAATLVLEVAAGPGTGRARCRMRRGGLWFRVAIFAPVMLPMVVVAVLWSFVYNPDFGLVNAAPRRRSGWRTSSASGSATPRPRCSRSASCRAGCSPGFYMMIFYAAFRQIPTEVLEAARLDGAGEWALFRRVKVPMIRNAIAVAVLLCVTGGFQGFDLFFVLTNGGPYGATEIPTTYLVKTVFRNGDVGYGSAMAVVLTAIVLGVGLVYTRLHRPRIRGVTGAIRPMPARGGSPGMLVVGRTRPPRGRVLLPDGLDGALELQVELGDLPVAVRAARRPSTSVAGPRRGRWATSAATRSTARSSPASSVTAHPGAAARPRLSRSAATGSAGAGS